MGLAAELAKKVQHSLRFYMAATSKKLFGDYRGLPRQCIHHSNTAATAEGVRNQQRSLLDRFSRLMREARKRQKKITDFFPVVSITRSVAPVKKTKKSRQKCIFRIFGGKFAIFFFRILMKFAVLERDRGVFYPSVKKESKSESIRPFFDPSKISNFFLHFCLRKRQ